MPVIERITVPTDRLPNGLRLAFAADFHIRAHTSPDYIAKLCAALGSTGADMLLLGGDYGETPSAACNFFDALAPFAFPQGVYAVAGNNDRECFPSYADFRQAARVPVLINETAHIRVQNKILEIGGVDELKHGKPDARRLFSAQADYRILLSHYPVIPSFGKGAPADLILSGHSHGGQVNLWGFTSYTLGIERDKAAHVAGMRVYGDLRLLVTTGIGMSKLPIRIGAKPRIHLISFEKPE